MRRFHRFLSVSIVSIVAVSVLAGCQSIGRGSFGPFDRSLNHTSYGYQVMDDPTGSAPTSAVERFEVQPGDCASDTGWSDCANDRERSELSEKGRRNPVGSTYWYGWSLFLPHDYINIYPTKVALAQFHQERSHPVWMFQNSNGGYSLDQQVYGSTSRYYKLIDEKDLRGRWHRIEVHASWSKSDTGFFRVWVNDEQKVDYSGRTMSASKTYFKYGVYRSFMSRYRNAKGVEDVPAQVVYYSNVKRASSREDLAAPVPVSVP